MKDLSLDKLISLYKSTRKLQGEYDYLLKIREDIGNSEVFYFDIIGNDVDIFLEYLNEDENFNQFDFLTETEIIFETILQFDDKKFKNSEKLIISLLKKYDDLKQKYKDKYNFQ